MPPTNIWSTTVLSHETIEPDRRRLRPFHTLVDLTLVENQSEPIPSQAFCAEVAHIRLR
jgi:hypothetical protein